MDNFRPNNMATVMKSENKKDMLLSGKDPHLSHLFGDHGGPNIPHNMATDNISQPNIDVDGNYREDSNEQDYSLFQEQGASFMPAGFSSESSQLVMDVNCTGASGATRSRGGHSDENNNNCREKMKMPVSGSHHQIQSVKKSNIQQPMRPPNLMIHPKITEAKSREDEKPQLLSPSADSTYNMQLLAHSAQQQQQLLQQERQQQEMFGQGSSSAALQHLAKLHQQGEQGVEVIQDHSSFGAKSIAYSPYAHGDAVKVEAMGKQGPMPQPMANAALNQSQMAYSSSVQTLAKQSAVLSSNYQNWSSGERAIQEFEKGHVRDLSFSSQDSPIFALPTGGDLAKSTGVSKAASTHIYQKQPVSLPSAHVVEPELKSPLDHPDQLERHRSRFFSSDSGAASGGEQQPEDDDDEAPLNEQDKKAAAAISKLMEQGEKHPPVVHINPTFYKAPHSGNIDPNFVRPALPPSNIPLNFLQVQELLRNTPPPTYEQSLIPGVPGSLPPALLAHTSQAHAMTIPSSEVKQEPNSPATKAPPRHYYIPPQDPYKPSQNCGPVSMQEEQAKYHPVSTVDRNCGISVGNPLSSAANVSYLQPTSSVNPEKVTSLPANKPTQTARPRRTSSSGSNRRKSDGNLTCGLCGHSFKSTPALNGHMRVHSNPEKKQNKEERQSRSASNDNAAKASLIKQPAISSQSQPYFDGGKLQYAVPMQADANVNPDGSVRVYPYQYPTEALDPNLSNRPHNGLLTMASAACFLKTEANKEDYPNAVIPSAYIVPHPVLFQQPSVVPSTYHVDVLNPSLASENAPAAHPFQPGLPFGFFTNVSQVAQPIVPQETVYPNNQPQVQMLPSGDRDMNINPQNFPNQAEKPMGMVSQDEPYANQYAVNQNTETQNSLSQLASIAVAAANREYDPNPAMTSNMPANYAANDMQPTNAEAATAENVGLMQTNLGPGSQQDCLGQEEVFQPSNMTSETSPLQSGHDPFIFPVSGQSQNQQRSQYHEYISINNTVPGNREPMVTWKDNVDTRSYPLLSSYDDPLMQEAVNVANPSKILPNSMMGGTPNSGSILSGARPFRQRHHSEGAHLIKNRENSILKRILDHSVAGELPVGNERLADNSGQEIIAAQPPSEVLRAVEAFPPTVPDKNLEQEPSVASETKKVEIWAEPKPIQRRIRRRRHSADSRLFLKPGPLPSRLAHAGGQAKKTTAMRKDRARRPPPLVIPSSVNTYTPGQNTYHSYQSHLHHRRRPSGENAASVAGFNDKIPPYTPPPMLSPIRAGSGLYCTTPVTPMFNRQKSMDGGIPTIMEVDESGEEDEELVRSSEPKINIGSRFQARIPPMLPRSTTSSCKHKANKVWSPESAGKNEKVFKHLEQFMDLSCSAVVPFGGSNKEFALDCISQSNGLILNAVRRLITRKKESVLSSKKSKNYTGSGKPWSDEEAKQFDCAMLQHRKDFFVISKMVKSRTTAECVERYYHVVKRNRRQSRLPRRYRDQETDEFATRLADSLNEKKSFSSSPSSSDDELTSKSKISSDTDVGSWMSSSDQQSRLDHFSSYSGPSSPPSVSAHPQQHIFNKPIKTHAARVQHGRIETPSPVGSPVSTISNDEQPSQVFTCPVCGKSFAKVKSRNAHMKTHGKQAQEKRRQREEAAARRREELANRQLPTAHRPVGPPPLAHPNFIHGPPVGPQKLFSHAAHHHLPQQALADMPRYSSGM